MTNIILCGCNGNMGKVISRLAIDRDDTTIVAGIDINTDKNFDYPVFSDPKDCNINADVIIDFSHPSVFDAITDYALSTNTPIVIATTGLGDDNLAKIKDISNKIPVFHSANMSLGINLLSELLKKATPILKDDFDIEIIEKHHNKKIDAPSGTALALADCISSVLDYDAEYKYDRHSQRAKRDKKEIGISSIRGGTIVGEHSVIFAGNDEVIEFKHTATSKDVFGIGSLKAAIYLENKEAGLYSMSDLVNEE